MDDAGASVANTSPALAQSAAPSRLAVYYALVVTQAVSLVGSQVSQYAVGIAIYRATGHATPIALVAFFSTVPAIVLGGLGGALADRFDRRGMMLIANLGYVVVTGLLLLSFASGAFQPWHLYALTAGGAVFAAVERPAFQASVAMLVPDSHRDRANAIGQMTGPAAGMGLMFVVAGALVLALSLAVYAIPAVRRLEVDLPDHAAKAV